MYILWSLNKDLISRPINVKYIYFSCKSRILEIFKTFHHSVSHYSYIMVYHRKFFFFLKTELRKTNPSNGIQCGAFSV